MEKLTHPLPRKIGFLTCAEANLHVFSPGKARSKNDCLSGQLQCTHRQKFTGADGCKYTRCTRFAVAPVVSRLILCIVPSKFGVLGSDCIFGFLASPRSKYVLAYRLKNSMANTICYFLETFFKNLKNAL